MNFFTLRQARKRIAAALQNDPQLRQGYVDNIACVIMDHIPGYKRDKSRRDAIAEKILERIFE